MTAADLAMQPASPFYLRKAAGIVGLASLFALGLLAAVSRFVAIFPPGMLHTGAALAFPSPAHPFGTDALGRDLWSETLYALGITMSDACLGFVVALVAGTVAGFLAGHAFGRAGIGLRIGIDVLVSIPALLLAILFSALLGQGHAAIAAGFAAAPAAFARAYDRARQHLTAPSSHFARTTGVSEFALFERDLVCELRESLIPLSARAFAAVTITLATMSFFGFGAVAPARDFGLMIAVGQSTLPGEWWPAVFPAMALALLILSARLAAGLTGGERP